VKNLTLAREFRVDVKRNLAFLLFAASAFNRLGTQEIYVPNRLPYVP